MAEGTGASRFTRADGTFDIPEIARALDAGEELPASLIGNTELAEALLDYFPDTVDLLSDEQLDQRRRDAIAQLRAKWLGSGLIPQRRSEATLPVCAIVIGQTGAGKSSVIAMRVAAHLRAWLVDADEIKQLLPEYRKGYGNQAVHRESANIRTQFELRAQLAEESYVHQMTGDDPDALLVMIERLHELGYRVWLYLVDVSTDVATGRSLQRFHEGTQGYIPPSVTAAIGDQPVAAYNLAKGHADGYAKIDNNDKPNCVEVHNAWVPEPL
jgi:hypothetical protein